MRFNQSRKSILCLESIAKLAVVFCVLPNCEFKNRPLHQHMFLKFYTLIIISVVFGTSVYSIYSRYTNAEEIYGNIGAVVKFLDICSELFALLLFLISAFGSISRKAIKWNELIQKFVSLEDSQNLNTEETKDFSFFSNASSMFIISSFAHFVLWYLETVYNPAGSMTVIRYYGVNCFLTYAELFHINIISNLFICIKRKYEDVNEIVMRNDTDIFNITQRIKIVERLYSEMDTITILVNEWYGWIFLAMFSQIIMMILHTLTSPISLYYLSSNKMEIWSEAQILHIIYGIFSIVSE
nr:uncharacterized protein LOC111509965 [Leptinotarsa decemlineata]